MVMFVRTMLVRTMLVSSMGVPVRVVVPGVVVVVGHGVSPS